MRAFHEVRPKRTLELVRPAARVKLSTRQKVRAPVDRALSSRRMRIGVDARLLRTSPPRHPVSSARTRDAGRRFKDEPNWQRCSAQERGTLSARTLAGRLGSWDRSRGSRWHRRPCSARSPRKNAAMLAGQLASALSSTIPLIPLIPLIRLTSCVQQPNEFRCSSRIIAACSSGSITPSNTPAF